jgi:hypothetical protein
MEVLLIAAVAASNILCFLVGARVGQQAVKGEDIEMPTVNPIEVYREHRAKQEARWEQDRVDTILRNIESYDGTSYGQEDVPGR